MQLSTSSYRVYWNPEFLDLFTLLNPHQGAYAMIETKQKLTLP
jgi:hypothetical protein